MTRSSSNSIEPGSDKISLDPYQIPEIAQRLMRSASKGDMALSKRDYQTLSRLYPTSRSLGMLERTSLGATTIWSEKNAFIVLSKAEISSIASATMCYVKEATTQAEKIGLHAPILVVEIIQNAPAVALLSSDIPGFYHLLLGGNYSGAIKARATIFHEMGHAILSSGCRFLDEGWAVYFSYFANTDDVYPLPCRRIPSFLQDNSALVVNLHALLALPSSDALVFENITENGIERQIIYVQAYLLVAHLVKIRGIEILRRLFADVRAQTDPAQVGYSFEKIIGKSVAQLHREIFKSTQLAGDVSNDLDGVFRRALTELRIHDLLGLKNSSDHLRNIRGLGIDDVNATLVLLRLLLACSEGMAERYKLLFRAEISALFAELARKGEGSKEMFELKALFADASARTSSNAVERVGWEFKREEARRQVNLAQPIGGVVGEICMFSKTKKYTENQQPPLPSDRDKMDRNPEHHPVSVQRLEVNFGKKFVLTVQDFDCHQSQITAIVGANGAGKTTLLSSLAGIVTPRIADGSVLGVPLNQWRANRNAKAQFGAQLQRLTQHPGLYVRDLVRIHGSLYKTVAGRGIAVELDLDGLAEKSYGSLSQGQRQRVNIYLAAAHQPKVLLLDEPTGGLDQKFRERVRQLILNERARGCCVLLSSHNADLLEDSDQVAWIRDGSLYRVAPLQTLLTEYFSKFRGILECGDDATASALKRKLASQLSITHIYSRQAQQLVMFGDHKFREEFDAIAKADGVVAYQFGAASSSDLLALASGDYQ